MARLDVHRLLSDKQHAFRKWNSCETQLTIMIDDWAKILDNQCQLQVVVDTFILDLKRPLTLPRMNSLKANCLVMEYNQMDRCFSMLQRTEICYKWC